MSEDFTALPDLPPTQKEYILRLIAAARIDGERKAQAAAAAAQPNDVEYINKLMSEAKADAERIAREAFARQREINAKLAARPSAGAASFRFLINRLREPKTYIGLIALAGVVGVTRPDLDVWILAAAGVFTFIAGLLPEVGAVDEKRNEI